MLHIVLFIINRFLIYDIQDNVDLVLLSFNGATAPIVSHKIKKSMLKSMGGRFMSSMMYKLEVTMAVD